MSYSVYSFKSIVAEIATLNGKKFAINSGVNTSVGIGSIAISMANDITIHDIGVDGGIIIWPVAVYNGTVVITVQQTSALHDFLLSWYSDITMMLKSNNALGAQYWAGNSMVIHDLTGTVTSNIHIITGISPQRIPDRTYTTQGTNVIWNLMAGNIESYPASNQTY